jgi:hypothetical protein
MTFLFITLSVTMTFLYITLSVTMTFLFIIPFRIYAVHYSMLKLQKKVAKNPDL